MTQRTEAAAKAEELIRRAVVMLDEAERTAYAGGVTQLELLHRVQDEAEHAASEMHLQTYP